jgi:hypothetical protein
MAAIGSYYLEVVREAVDRVAKFAKAQGLVIGVVLSFLGVAVGLGVEIYRHPSRSALVKDLNELLVTALISGVAPIIIVGFAAFVFYLVRAPAELADKSRLAYEELATSRLVLLREHAEITAKFNLRIEQFEQQIAARTPDLTFKIEYWGQLMTFLGPGESFGNNVLIELSIRNSGERTALSDWKLEIPSITTEPISPRRDPWQEQALKHLRDGQTGARLTSDILAKTDAGLGRGDIVRGAMIFLIPGMSRQIYDDTTFRAYLRCLDARGLSQATQSEEPAIKIG